MDCSECQACVGSDGHEDSCSRRRFTADERERIAAFLRDDAPEYQRGYADGVKAERAAIVAWLRDRWVDVAGKFMARELPDMERAEQIERGAHVTPREAEEGKGS